VNVYIVFAFTLFHMSMKNWPIQNMESFFFFWYIYIH